MAGKYDEMSFGKAFAAARKAKGAGKTFTWKGKSYSTNYKEDAKSKAPTTSKRPKANPKREPAAKPPKPRSPITTTRLSDVRGGRGDGRAETNRRRTDQMVDRVRKAINSAPVDGKPSKRVTYEQWKDMTRAQRKAQGLPLSVTGWQMRGNRTPSPKPTTRGSSSKRASRK